ncbi:hypothetical protein Salat_0926400 [Sesamum alatum]|uniref:Uncharacterized protein n=1 Tax=Sesamum alatum TaxID=300844 RepID=A0AAE2CRC3_9LAMI|nr:hypothetical protein Salat_0926400 [Sesamum alatum]
MSKPRNDASSICGARLVLLPSHRTTLVTCAWHYTLPLCIMPDRHCLEAAFTPRRIHHSLDGSPRPFQYLPAAVSPSTVSHTLMLALDLCCLQLVGRISPERCWRRLSLRSWLYVLTARYDALTHTVMTVQLLRVSGLRATVQRFGNGGWIVRFSHRAKKCLVVQMLEEISGIEPSPESNIRRWIGATTMIVSRLEDLLEACCSH